MDETRVTKERLRRIYGEELRLTGEAVRSTLASAQHALQQASYWVNDLAETGRDIRNSIESTLMRFASAADEQASFWVAARREVERRG